ncbi:cytochrome P450 [Trichoderma sp. SZMC 28015]
MTTSKNSNIPQPRTIPLLGNIPDINLEYPLGSLLHLADKYGPIYKLSIGGTKLVILSSYEFVNEVCDDSRFKKSIQGDLEELRAVVHDGLFTSSGEDEENWGIAHRVLMSAFGPMSIRGMFDNMHEVSSQLTLKWARYGSSTPISVGEDFTRLTLDTVALCSMGFRFNSYYRDDMHPFIKAMYAVLKAAGDRNMRVLPSILHKSADRKFESNIAILRSTAGQVLAARQKSPDATGDPKDLLNAMINGVDPKTGRKMTEQSIIDNLITFLVAGHETTAATLSFTMYQLVTNPDVYRKVQAEIDRVVGSGPIMIDHVGKLKYLSAVIRETLRFNAPISAFAREATKDETIGGKYRVKAGEQLVCLLAKSHLDPKVYGDTANEFVPERMMEENFNRLMKEYPHCWSPFGTGLRSCIGRPFAWQEMILALAMLMQNFNFVMDNPSYSLSVQETLTIKPKDFKIRAIPRGGLMPFQLEARLAGAFSGKTPGPLPISDQQSRSTLSASPLNSVAKVSGGTKLTIFYGSDSGTCEFMAQRLANDASSHGFKATVDTLDAGREALPTDGPIVIITSSYEGQPPHNAGHFVDWIQNMDGEKLDNVAYAVYGCGHSDWVKSFHRIPRLVDSTLEKLGARRIVSMGTTNAKDRDMFSDFECWEDELLWPAIEKQFGGCTENDKSPISGLSVSFSTPRAVTLRQDTREGFVVAARTLVTSKSLSKKRHLEVRLPSDITYATGDYLAVLPHNPKETVLRAIRRFNLAWDSHVVITASEPTTLPTDTSIPISSLLTSYVELGQPATKRNVLSLYLLAEDGKSKQQLYHLATDAYETEVRLKRVSTLDIAEQFPDLLIPFNHFLLLLPPMRVRKYSISSSPLSDPTTATLTYSVIDSPALSGNGRYIGVTSSYLSSLAPGDRLQVSIRAGQGGFRLPADSSKTPIICIATGTGIAPFRAFIEERSIILKSGRSLAPAVLFYGCRNPSDDDLYYDEFCTWEAAGAVTVFRSYSRQPEASHGCKYVQDRMWHERQNVTQLWDSNAKIYVCGSNVMADGVRETLIRILSNKLQTKGVPMGKKEAMEWFERITSERYAIDVFD